MESQQEKANVSTKEVCLKYVRDYLLGHDPTGISSNTFKPDEIERGYDWPGASCWVNPPANEFGESIPIEIDGYFILNDGSIYVQANDGRDFNIESLMGDSLERIAKTFYRNQLMEENGF